jgi:hypothetical protein
MRWHGCFPVMLLVFAGCAAKIDSTSTSPSARVPPGPAASSQPGQPTEPSPPVDAGSASGDDAMSGSSVVASADAGSQAEASVDASLTSGTIWTSDDGPILGLAVSGDSIFVVTQEKLTSMARDGSQVQVLQQTAQRFGYSGAIAVNDETVYWGTSVGASGQEAGTVWAITRDGEMTTIGDEGYNVVGLGLDEARVYWLTNDAVLSAPLGGGSETSLAPLAGLSYENDLALAGGDLYWSTNSSAVGSQMAGVFRMPSTGATPTSIGNGPVFSLEATAEGVAWLENPTPVIVATPAGGTAQRIPLSGSVSEVATDGGHWYWRDDGTGVLRVLANGATVSQPLTQAVAAATANDGDGRHILVDQGEVIWADRSGPIASQPDVNVLRVLALPPMQ